MLFAQKSAIVSPIMIIDFHTHVFPHKIALGAMTHLANANGVPYVAPAIVESLIEAMDRCAIDKSVVLNVATKENQHENILRFAKETDSDRLIAFGSVVPDSVHALEYVWKISDEGLKGIKFHPGLLRVDADDKNIFPVYDLARALNLIVVFHAGYDYTYPDEMRASPKMILNVLDNFPGLRIVAAHMGGLRMATEALETLAGKANLYFDTAYTADPWLDRATMLKMIRLHGAEKILFGSDFPWHDPSSELELIRSLALTEEEKRLILGENAKRLLAL